MPGTVSNYFCTWHFFNRNEYRNYNLFKEENVFNANDDNQMRLFWQMVNGTATKKFKQHKHEEKKILTENEKKTLNEKCKKLMNDRLDNKITSFELSEKMFELDKEFPGMGFAEHAGKILKNFEMRSEK